MTSQCPPGTRRTCRIEGRESGLSNKPISHNLSVSLNKPHSEEPEAHASGAHLLHQRKISTSHQTKLEVCQSFVSLVQCNRLLQRQVSKLQDPILDNGGTKSSAKDSSQTAARGNRNERKEVIIPTAPASTSLGRLHNSTEPTAKKDPTLLYTLDNNKWTRSPV